MMVENYSSILNHIDKCEVIIVKHLELLTFKYISNSM